MKKLLIVLSSLGFLIFPQWDVNGCVDYTPPEKYRMFLMQPDISGKRHMGPLYFTTNYYFDLNASVVEMDKAAQEKNIADWVAYFKGKYNAAQVEKIIYGVDAKCLGDNNCKNNLFKEYPELKPLFEKNNHTGEYIQYMGHVLDALYERYDPWWSGNKLDISKPLRLVDEGEKLLKKNKADKFITKRIALQIIRLHYYIAFYGGEDYARHKQELAKIYNTYFSPDRTEDWIDGSAYFYAASSGALDGDRNYLLSLAYDRSEEKKFRCVELFERKELETTLTFAKNKHEKAVLYAMWLLQYPGRGLDKLQTIYALDPGYEEFDLLLSRELNKLEDWILTPQAARMEPANTKREEEDETYWWPSLAQYDSLSQVNLAADFEYLDKVMAFTQKIIDGERQKKKAMWHLYLAHLYQLKKDTTNADKQLALAENANKTEKDPRIETQLTIEWLMNHFQKADKLDETGKRLLLDFHKMAQNPNAPHLKQLEQKMLQYAGYLLQKKGETGWAALLINRSQANKYDSWWYAMGEYINIYHFLTANGTDKDVELVLGILDKTQRSEFENFLIQNSYYKPGQEDSKPLLVEKNKVLDYYAKIFVKKDNLEKALGYLKRISDDYWKQEPHRLFKDDDPFIIDIEDPHNYSKSDKKICNFRELVEGMIAIKKQLNEGKEKTDSLCFTLGNAYYNISWHGKFWIAQECYWSMHEFPPTSPYYDPAAPTANPDYYTTQRAEYWYNRALQTTKNPMLGAACALLASQCRSNKEVYDEVIRHGSYDLIDWDELTNRPDVFESEYRKRFNKDYYEKMRDECDLWQDFFTGWQASGTAYKRDGY